MCKRKWYKISADNKVLGRLAVRAAGILMGKNKVDYIPHKDNGDFLIVTDARKVKVTGNKREDKYYFRRSRYPGNSKSISFERMMKNTPEYIICHAVKGMLPKNKLASRMITRLKVYPSGDHPHQSQNPLEI